VRLGDLEAGHAFVVGDGYEERAVGVAVAHERVDLECGAAGVAAVDAPAVVDDAFEDRRGADAHRVIMDGMDDHHQARAAEETRGLAIMREAAEQLIAGVRRAIPPWAVAVVAERYQQWTGSALPETLRVQAERSGEAAATRVAEQLAALLALDPEAQAATPLEIVRSAVREPTDVLRAAGVGEVVRDDFATRAWPHDVYGIVPNTIADFGDEALAPLHVAWGVGKATVIKARRQPAPGPDQNNTN